MSDAFYQRLTRIFGLFVLAAIFGVHIFIANIEIKDLDLWLHIGMGRHIVQNGFHVPSVDILSCTIAGKPWVNHEWLFQVLVYSIFTQWGSFGLITMQVLLVTVTMMILLFLGYNNEKQFGSIFILVLLSIIYQGRFTTRPDLFSLLFFALYIFLLAFYIHRKWSLYAFVILQILWTNIHGFFFFGPLFVLVGLFAEFTKRHIKLPYEWNKIGRLTDDEYHRLKLIFLATVLACLCNPMTLQGAWYPLKVFFSLSGESRIFFERIVELKRPITKATIFSPDVYPFYKIMIILSFSSFVFNRRKLDLGVLIFWLVFLFFSLSAVRNLVFFAFAGYLAFVTNILTMNLRDIAPIRITDKKFTYLTTAVLKILLVFWVIQYGMERSTFGYYDFDTYEKKSEYGGISKQNYPFKAVDFLVKNKIKGNFFNDFNSGAYLVGHCFPDIKVFIDGRTEVYGPKFFLYYEELWDKSNAKEFAKMLKRYKMTGVFLSSVRGPIPERIVKYMQLQKDWVPVYFDYDGIIYLKDIEQNKQVIEEYQIDFSQWKPIPTDLLRLGPKKVLPDRNVHRAFTLESMGYPDQAMLELKEAIEIAPYHDRSYRLLGKIYADKKDFWNAYKSFRIAVVYNPLKLNLRLALAQSCYDMGEYSYAIDHYNKIMVRWPNEPKSYFMKARALIKINKADEALKALQAGLKLVPKAIPDIIEIGDMMFDQGLYQQALKVYSFGLTSKKHLDKIHLKLGSVYEKLGLLDQAGEELKKAGKLSLGNEKVQETESTYRLEEDPEEE